MAQMRKKQKAILDNMGVEYNPYMTGYQAYKLIERLNKEKGASFATQKQKDYMDDLNILYDDDITSAEAWRVTNEAIQRSRELADEVDCKTDSLFDLADKNVKWTTKSRNHAKGRCPFSTCNSNDFYVNRKLNVGGCNGCGWYQKGNGASAIAYYCEKEGVKWYEAARRLSNEWDMDVRSQLAKKKATKNLKMTADQFRRLWQPRLDWGRGALEHSDSMRYLQGRGITFETATAFGIGIDKRGYGPHKGRECILFPYYHANGLLCALNRRVSADVEHDKCWFASGSEKIIGYFGLYGWSGFTWVIEGEINAQSVWQALWGMGRSDTVLSLSSESDIKGRAGEIQKRFDNVVVWCDKQAIADVVKAAGVTAWATKRDANELLLDGRLQDCINWILSQGASAHDRFVKDALILTHTEPKK